MMATQYRFWKNVGLVLITLMTVSCKAWQPLEKKPTDTDLTQELDSRLPITDSEQRDKEIQLSQAFFDIKLHGYDDDDCAIVQVINKTEFYVVAVSGQYELQDPKDTSHILLNGLTFYDGQSRLLPGGSTNDVPFESLCSETINKQLEKQPDHPRAINTKALRSQVTDDNVILRVHSLAYTNLDVIQNLRQYFIVNLAKRIEPDLIILELVNNTGRPIKNVSGDLIAEVESGSTLALEVNRYNLEQNTEDITVISLLSQDEELAPGDRIYLSIKISRKMSRDFFHNETAYALLDSLDSGTTVNFYFEPDEILYTDGSFEKDLEIPVSIETAESPNN